MEHVDEDLYTLRIREAVGMPVEAQLNELAEEECENSRCKNGQTPWGVCYRCQGKVGRTWADVCRNYYYDLKAGRVEEPVEPKPEESSPEPTVSREFQQVESMPDWMEADEEVGGMFDL